MLKKWWFWTIVGLSILCVLFLGIIILSTIGFNNLSEAKEEELVSLKAENNNVQKQYKELTDKISELQKESEQEEINNIIKKLKDNQKELQEDIKKKEAEKSSLEKELKKLNGDIAIAKGKAKTYPAGRLTAGEDFEVGRYKIYGGSSNFVVYSMFGDLEVNIILGGNYGVDEYLYEFSEGDEVRAESSFKMQPIE